MDNILIGLTLVDSIPIVDMITISTIVWYEVVVGQVFKGT